MVRVFREFIIIIFIIFVVLGQVFKVYIIKGVVIRWLIIASLPVFTKDIVSTSNDSSEVVIVVNFYVNWTV